MQVAILPMYSKYRILVQINTHDVKTILTSSSGGKSVEFAFAIALLTAKLAAFFDASCPSSQPFDATAGGPMKLAKLNWAVESVAKATNANKLNIVKFILLYYSLLIPHLVVD